MHRLMLNRAANSAHTDTESQEDMICCRPFIIIDNIIEAFKRFALLNESNLFYDPAQRFTVRL